MVIYLPVFGGATPRSVEGRRELLQGWVNVVLRIDDVFTDALASPSSPARASRIHDLGAAHWAGRARARGGHASSTARRRRPPAGSAPAFALDLRHDVDLDVAGRAMAAAVRGRPARPSTRGCARCRCSCWAPGSPSACCSTGSCARITRTRIEAVEIANQRHARPALAALVQPAAARGDPATRSTSRTPRAATSAATARSSASIGITRDELVGRTPHDLMPEEIADRLVERRPASCSSTGGVHTHRDATCRTQGRHGARRDLQQGDVRATPTARSRASSGVIVDITERKELEAATRSSHEQLQRDRRRPRRSRSSCATSTA